MAKAKKADPPHDSEAASGNGTAVAYQAGVEFFLGPIVPLLRDETVTEIMVNGPRDVFVERAGRIEQSDAAFEDDAAVRAAANNIAQYVGKTIDEQEPILDGRLPDGSRVCIVLDPIAAHGTSINIRRFSQKANTPDFLLEKGSITPQALEFVQLAVRAGLNIVVAGGTGSGKTTILNILSNVFSDEERIVVIEDTRELQVQKKHVVQMEARPPDAYGRGEITVRDLFVTSLRMRPDRIVVGEVRRGEALDMVQAMTSGHRGSLATLHADTPPQTCGRLETMCMMADVGLPLAALRRQVALALDLVVQSARLHSGRRLITHVSEIGLDEATNTYQIQDLFHLDTTSGEPQLVWTGRRPALADEIGWKGLAGDVKLTKDVFAAGPEGGGGK
jgi:pilus assembly protein CpaF